MQLVGLDTKAVLELPEDGSALHLGRTAQCGVTSPSVSRKHGSVRRLPQQNGSSSDQQIAELQAHRPLWVAKAQPAHGGNGSGSHEPLEPGATCQVGACCPGPLCPAGQNCHVYNALYGTHKPECIGLCLETCNTVQQEPGAFDDVASISNRHDLTRQCYALGYACAAGCWMLDGPHSCTQAT